MENKTIGITFSVPDKPMNMFSSGHRQNVIYFYDVLFLLGYNVYLITDKQPIIEGIYGFNYEKYKTVVYENNLNEKIKFNNKYKILIENI